ncbi:MAG TPA: 50S ribosomal protein L18 [Eubacteriales bacterium]|nr:50S ribosomal protein L18 [Clostridia bacterium]HRV73421.1 50S ribosomal protein L18 [Eubacteriales bacterium]
MFSKIDKNSVRMARHYRQRRNLVGTSERPRLNVYRSTNHIYAQVIDDLTGSTLVAASTLDAQVKSGLDGKSKTDAAKLVGKVVGQRAIEKGVKKVVFDRGGYLYTGRVAALAAGAREAGLDF